MVRKVAETLAGKGVVVQVNTEENPALASRFAVSGIPALFLLKKGRIIDKKAGAHAADTVISWFRNHSKKTDIDLDSIQYRTGKTNAR